MKKLQTMLLAALAVSALSALCVAAASAEETLLANWLANGTEVNTSLAATITGGLLLEDTETIAGKAAILCESILVGSVGPDGEGEVSEIQNLAKEKIGALGGLALKCVSESTCAAATEASPIEVWPLGLPWLFLIYISIIPFRFVFELLSHASSSLGFELLCLVLGINTEDTCTVERDTIEVLNDADTGDASFPGGFKVAPNSNCTQSGGKATGVAETDALTPILLTNGELLTVSE